MIDSELVGSTEFYSYEPASEPLHIYVTEKAGLEARLAPLRRMIRHLPSVYR